MDQAWVLTLTHSISVHLYSSYMLWCCIFVVHAASFNTLRRQKKRFAKLALLSMSSQTRDWETVERELLGHFKLILIIKVFFPTLTWLFCVRILAQLWRLAHALRNWLPPSLALLKLQHFTFLWQVKKPLWWNLILFFRACWAYTVSSYPYSLRCEGRKNRRQLEVFANSVLENDL